MKWEKIEFDRVANETRLGKSMIAACRDVLVDGTTGAEAAKKHDVLPPHISRSLKVLREKREELRMSDLETAKALRVMGVATKQLVVPETGPDMSSVLNAAAREAAQSIKGVGWVIREGAPGQSYEGSGVVKVGGFFVQDIGRIGIIHDLKNLDVEPVLGKRWEISYSSNGKGSVKDIPIDRGTRENER